MIWQHDSRIQTVRGKGAREAMCEVWESEKNSNEKNERNGGKMIDSSFSHSIE